MRRIVVAAFGSAVLATTATAADLANTAPPPVWNWAGFYLGLHTGAVTPGFTQFSGPFGSSIYGDRIRTPGWLAGGQVGYNWQAANQSPWVFGIEADVSGLDSDGANTCFAVSGDVINATCRVRPDLSATLTGRIGYAFGPQGRTLFYMKGGLAWLHGRIDMATNDAAEPPGDGTPPITANKSHYDVWGGTVGAGVEYAVTPAWSVKLEYDYLRFGRTHIATLGSDTVDAAGATVSQAPPGSAAVRDDLHQFKLGVNYKWGADPRAAWPSLASIMPAIPSKAPMYKASSLPTWAPGWEVEAGGRYVASWSRFQYDLGLNQSAGAPPISAISRLTYSAMKNDAGEVFARLDTPWNWFVKGFLGSSKTHDGKMNDEDFGIAINSRFVPYSNTILPKVDGDSKYATIDVGYDWWRGVTYKAGAFVGYNQLEQHMFAHGCIQIANPNSVCAPPVPVSDLGGITQDNKWKSLRVGVGGEFMPYQRIKLSGEVAYLPYVRFDGVDHHLFLGSGAIASINPEKGDGRGVQLEALVSYELTPTFSVGVGGRYWAMWTSPSGEFRRTVECPAPGTCTTLAGSPQFLRGSMEQASVFVQASVKFDSARMSAGY